MPKNIQFGKMVERYMRLNKLTMKELGEKVGRGESTVSMWISNKSTPPAECDFYLHTGNFFMKLINYIKKKKKDQFTDIFLKTVQRKPMK